MKGIFGCFKGQMDTPLKFAIAERLESIKKGYGIILYRHISHVCASELGRASLPQCWRWRQQELCYPPSLELNPQQRPKCYIG